MSNDSDIDRSRALIEEIQAGIDKLLSGDLHPKGSTPARHSPDEKEVVPHLTVIHQRWFWTSLALSLLVAVLSAKDLAHGLHEADLREDLVRPFQELPTILNGLSEPVAHAASAPAQAHAPPKLIPAAIQMLAVVAISIMSFYAFQLYETLRHPRSRTLPFHTHARSVVLSLLPIAIFLLAMYQAYQPAVLVMAIAAIVVAAEHFSGLKLQEDALEQQHAQLEGQHQEQDRQAKGIGRLLADAGLSHYVSAVYREYGGTDFIRAVVRQHEIDFVWWLAAAADPRSRKTADPWGLYFQLALDGNPRTNTLAKALALDDRRTMLDARFVTDLPMPESTEWEQRISDDREPLFEDLLGFAWQLAVVDHARKEGKDKKCEVSAWVSRPLAWVHSTRTTVFQVLRREPRDQSAAIVIADLNERCTAAEKIAHQGLLTWAHDEIGRYLDRSCSAEEYFLATIRYAMLKGSKTDDAVLVHITVEATAKEGFVIAPSATLRYLVSLLDGHDEKADGGEERYLDHWIKSQARVRRGVNLILDDARLKELAVGIVARVIHRCVRHPARPNEITGGDLSRELL